jgi:hypothetical protein
MNTASTNQQIECFSIVTGIVAFFVWFISGILIYIYSLGVVKTDNLSTTAVMGQSYGTAYTETVRYSLKNTKDVEGSSAWYKYWNEYYTAADETRVAGSSEYTYSTAEWYANSEGITCITILYFIGMLFFAGIANSLSKYSKAINRIVNVGYSVLFLVPIAFNICKAVFLYQIQH